MDPKFKINSLYICVNDMQCAIGFYEDLLDQRVIEITTPVDMY